MDFKERVIAAVRESGEPGSYLGIPIRERCLANDITRPPGLISIWFHAIDPKTLVSYGCAYVITDDDTLDVLAIRREVALADIKALIDQDYPEEVESDVPALVDHA